MSEYVLKVENDVQAEALLTYLRSLDFVELLPKRTKQEAIAGMKSLLGGLPDQENYTQQEVNQAMSELSPKWNDQ